MKDLGEEADPRLASTRSRRLFRAACSLMALTAVGLVVAMILGAPLVSILLVGLLLICPLLMWVPVRFEERALDARSKARTGRG